MVISYTLFKEWIKTRTIKLPTNPCTCTCDASTYTHLTLLWLSADSNRTQLLNFIVNLLTAVKYQPTIKPAL